MTNEARLNQGFVARYPNRRIPHFTAYWSKKNSWRLVVINVRGQWRLNVWLCSWELLEASSSRIVYG